MLRRKKYENREEIAPQAGEFFVFGGNVNNSDTFSRHLGSKFGREQIRSANGIFFRDERSDQYGRTGSLAAHNSLRKYRPI